MQAYTIGISNRFNIKQIYTYKYLFSPRYASSQNAMSLIVLTWAVLERRSRSARCATSWVKENCGEPGESLFRPIPAAMGEARSFPYAVCDRSWDTLGSPLIFPHRKTEPIELNHEVSLSKVFQPTFRKDKYLHFHTFFLFVTIATTPGNMLSYSLGHSCTVLQVNWRSY